MSTNNIIGNIYDSNNYGKVQVIAKLIQIPEVKYKNIDYERYVIKFLNTGYMTDASYCAIRHGSVKDKSVPIVAGVGFVGSDILVSDPEYYELYKTWNDMINRCYNINDKKYSAYGGLGISVDPRWFNFSIFYMDAIFLPNYEKKEMYSSIYELDKDFLQMNIPKSQRVYSKDTCVWLSSFDNTIIMNRDYGNSSGYYGVLYLNGSWATRINGRVIGKFTTPEAAANLFNYEYPKLRTEFNDIMILNDVEPIPYEELSKYCIGSTTIQTFGIVPKRVRSDRVSFDFSTRYQNSIKNKDN